MYILCTHFSHAGWPEDCDDDEDVSPEAAEDHEAVEAGEDVEGGVANSLVVKNVLEK